MTRTILTAQTDAMSLALTEAGNPRVLRKLQPDVCLCEGVELKADPVFLRHICPADVEVPLTGAESDLGALKEALLPLLTRLSGGQDFSVQTRILTGATPAYKRFDVNTVLAEVAQASGAALNVKKPAMIVSVTIDTDIGWIGVSRAEGNISDWAGGARRFKMEEGQISRAEFKLLEAIETFGIALPDGGTALDLGAAPGGWTRILRRHGLSVTAVDPAKLDPRLEKDKRVLHFQGTAQTFFRKPQPFDVIVNDMKMDTRQSALLMVEGAPCLLPGGIALLTLKLPEAQSEWLPRLMNAKAILGPAYQVAGLRQLFHNRSEVTAYLTRL